jgi:murein DD-endopeptidase MepM/ murein hydrolase activator NlpD
MGSLMGWKRGLGKGRPGETGLPGGARRPERARRVRAAVWLAWALGAGMLAGPQAVWAMEGAPATAAGAGARPRETEVSDLGSNSVLPEALRPVFFPLPPDFAERAPATASAKERRGALPLADGQGAGIGAEGDMPSMGYPINQAPIEVSPFGMRWSESRGAWRMHTGMDLIVTEGTPVLAAAAGRVVLVDEVSGYGLTVLVDHGGGWQTLYAHLFELAVQPGERVQRGQPLGRVGDSGRASTPHLHFEIRQRRGDRMVALDPEPLLRPREPGAIVRRP